MAHAESITDGELMAGVRDGDFGRLGELFERHHVRLFNFFLRLTGNRQTSEDLVQEAFVRMLRYRHTFRGDGPFLAWMYSLGRNVCADHFRRHSREYLTETGDVPEQGGDAPLALEQLEQAESVQLLRRALLRLPLEKREVLVLSRFELMRYEDIAELLGCTVGAIKVRVHRALKQLQGIYRELANEAPS